MKKTAARTKNFVRRNKNAIVVGGIAITVIAIQYRGNKLHNEFLVEKGLFDEYYRGEE